MWSTALFSFYSSQFWKSLAKRPGNSSIHKVQVQNITVYVCTGSWKKFINWLSNSVLCFNPFQCTFVPLFHAIVYLSLLFSPSLVFYIHSFTLDARGWYRPHQPTLEKNQGGLTTSDRFIFPWNPFFFSLSIPLTGIAVVRLWPIAQRGKHDRDK